MIDGENLFAQLVKDNLRTYDNIWKIVNDQRDDYTTGCFARLSLFQKLLKDDSNKQQELDVDLKAIKQINFTESTGWFKNVFHY